jgi:flavodoxin I
MSILILYTSVGGNTEMVVKKVVETLQENQLQPTWKRVELTDPQEILAHDLVIFAAPTYGQGTVEATMRGFIMGLKGTVDITGRNVAIIGLGDDKYYPEYLTEAAGLMEEYVKTELKATMFVPTLRLGKPPLKFLNSLVKNWSTKLADAIKSTENPNPHNS